MSHIDLTKAKLTATYQHSGTLFCMCLDQRHGKLYGGSTDNAVHVVDLNAETKTSVPGWLNHTNYVAAMAFLQGKAFEDIIVTGGFDRQLIWTRIYDGKQVRSIEAHNGWVRDVAAFPDGARLVSVGDDMLVKVWDARTGTLLRSMGGHPMQTPQGYATALYAVAVSGDGRHVASADRIGEVRVWDADTGKLVQQWQSPEFYTYDPTKRVRSIGGIRSLSFASDGSKLAIAGIGQVTNVDGFVGPCRVEVWDWQAPKKLFTGQDKHKAVMNHVAFHPTERLLIAAGGGDSGGLLAFWDLKAETPIHKVKPKGHLQQFCLSASGMKLYAAGYGGFQVWDLAATGSPADGKT